MNMSKERKALLKLCISAMMTAIVFVGNFLRITLPVPLGGVTAFTLANILCALAGLLLGPWWGGLAAGLGSALYDFTNPAYVAEAPITFCTKGMYGLVAGLVLYCVFRASKEKYHAQVIASAYAAVSYMVVYFAKNYFYNGMFLSKFTEPAQCWALVLSKAPATIFNGTVAVIFAPILGVALMKALKRAHLYDIFS